MAPPPFSAFLDAHAGEVRRFLVAMVGPQEADDCAQETFIAALRAYPRLRDGSDPRAWVLTIARRKAIDAARAAGRRPVPVADPDPGPAAAPHAADGAGLWCAVRGLPPRQRAAVALRYACDLSYADVGRAMGCSEEAARRSAFEGVRRLREVWDGA